MPWSFIIPAAASLFGSSQQSSAAQSAADTQSAAADRATQLQREIFEKQVGLQEPFRQAGMAGQNRLLELLGLRTPDQAQQAPGADFGKYARDFGMADFQEDPGYGYRVKKGLEALERTAAARGGLLSGGALKAATRYGQEAGSQEYMNAFNRYQTSRANQLNPLQSLAGQGQTSANTIGSAAGQYGTNVGNLMMGTGETQANALLSGARARGSAYQGIGELYGRTQPNFGSLFGGGSSGPVSMPGYGGMYDTNTYMGR